MPAFKNPGFNERQDAAARARSASLAAYRAKPPVDEAVVAQRVARHDAQKAAAAEKRAAVIRAREEALRAKEAAAEAQREQEHQTAAAAEAAERMKAEATARAKADATARKVEERKLWTEADRKAARDERYAKRKARQGRG